MKLIIAIIQPYRLEAVKKALVEAEITRLTVQPVQGYGRQKGQTELHRGQEIEVNLLPKTQVSLAVPAERVPAAIEALLRGARSGPDGNGRVGDGKILVLPLEMAIRISDGTEGHAAL